VTRPATRAEAVQHPFTRGCPAATSSPRGDASVPWNRLGYENNAIEVIDVDVCSRSNDGSGLELHRPEAAWSGT
jgi:hypothetical protein